MTPKERLKNDIEQTNINRKTMTPKEKSEELVEKYLPLVRSAYPKDAIECAKIAVDEIIEITHYNDDKRKPNAFNKEYWQEVKQELEKL